MHPKLLIFDLDGTLVDSTDSVIAQLGAISEEFGAARLADEDIIDIVHRSGGSINAILPLLIGDEKASSKELVEQIRVRHSELLQEFSHLLKPYLGAVETLASLQERGYAMAIFTSRRQWMVKGDPSSELLLPYFDTVVTLEDTPRPKPHPDGIQVVLERTKTAPHDAWMIGDTAPDIASAHAAGVRAVALTHGYGTREELLAAGADEIIDSIPALLDVL